jgi:hypothetical protein
MTLTQFNLHSRVRVRFIPETRYRGSGKGRVSTRGLSDVDIEWEEWKGKTASDESSSSGGEEMIDP